VASTDRGSTVRSSYFKAVNKRVYTNQDNLDNGGDRETGNCTLSGDILRNSGISKRRKISTLRNFEDVSLFLFLSSCLFSGR
jgi:exonuclease 1